MKKTTLIVVLGLFMIANLLGQSMTVNGYTMQTVEGREVYVNDIALNNHAQKTREALDLLSDKLREIDNMDMLASATRFLKTVPFFMDWDRAPDGAAVYHPNRDWLVANGWIAEKAKTVNITNINNFINWTASNQPYMVLHELSHAYHDQILTYSNADIQNAYDQALAAGKYGEVDYYTGSSIQKRSAYAATNPQEYFAEITEAYYGRNDFYPFNRGELGMYDAQGYAALRKVWQGSTFDASIVSFDPSKYYRLTTQFTGPGKSLDVINDTNDDQVELRTTGNKTGQYWCIQALGNGYYRLTTRFTGPGKSLDVVNSAVDDKVELKTSGNYSGQMWRIERLTNGYYRLTTAFTGPGKSLDVINDANDDQVELKTTGNKTGQYWQITEL